MEVHDKLDMALDDIPSGGGGGGGKQRGKRDKGNRSTPYGGGGATQGKRVFVGNLAYSVAWQDLKDHMKAAGEVIYCDIMPEPGNASLSKGCGLVEYSSAEEAQTAIDTLTETELNGRNIFVREDRETMSIANATHGGLQRGRGRGRGRSYDDDDDDDGGGYGGRSGGGRGGGGGGRGSGVVIRTGGGNQLKLSSKGGGGGGGGGSQIFIGNLPWTTTWQNLKDVFANVGTVERADVNEGRDGRPSGSGIVKFARAADAAKAISKFDGADFDGRIIYVKYDEKA